MKLLGQGAAHARALAQSRRLDLHHGLLIEGPRGVGKSAAAEEITQALLCEDGPVTEPCRTCRVCAQVESRNHPDLHFLELEERPDKEKKRDISVEQVRDLQVTLGRSAMEGRARVAIVDPADRLNEQGQNALLKTLEEPGARTFLLLVTSQPEALLPTVRSRVSRLRILGLESADVVRVLADKKIGDPQTREQAAALAGGSIGLAQQLIEEEICGRHQHLVEFLEQPNKISAISVARELLAGTPNRAAAEQRARLVLCCAREHVRQTMVRSLAPSEGASYVPARCTPWTAVADRLLDAEADLNLTIGAEQALSYALLRIREELTGPI